jgi:hypothetical protein
MTLDPDVAARLADVRRAAGGDLQAIVNRALRSGLRTTKSVGTGVGQEPCEMTPISLGGCRLPDLNRVSEALSVTEGQGFH